MQLENIRENRPIGDVEKHTNMDVTNFLNGLLANEFSFFTKTLNFHWNITGPRFLSIHKTLENNYREILEVMDDIAERVRTLGERPIGTIKEVKALTTISEGQNKDLSTNEMLQELFKNSLHIQESIKETLQQKRLFDYDPGTEDLLVEVIRKHEKMSWMLKSSLS